MPRGKKRVIEGVEVEEDFEDDDFDKEASKPPKPTRTDKYNWIPMTAEELALYQKEKRLIAFIPYKEGIRLVTKMITDINGVQKACVGEGVLKP